MFNNYSYDCLPVEEMSLKNNCFKEKHLFVLHQFGREENGLESTIFLVWVD